MRSNPAFGSVEIPTWVTVLGIAGLGASVSIWHWVRAKNAADSQPGPATNRLAPANESARVVTIPVSSEAGSTITLLNRYANKLVLPAGKKFVEPFGQEVVPGYPEVTVDNTYDVKDPQAPFVVQVYVALPNSEEYPTAGAPYKPYKPGRLLSKGILTNWVWDTKEPEKAPVRWKASFDVVE